MVPSYVLWLINIAIVLIYISSSALWRVMWPNAHKMGVGEHLIDTLTENKGLWGCLLNGWMEQSVPAWMRIMVIYVTSVLSPRCEYLMEIRAHCMFLYLCGESGDKSTPPHSSRFSHLWRHSGFYILHEFPGCLGSRLQISGADIMI